MPEQLTREEIFSAIATEYEREYHPNTVGGVYSPETKIFADLHMNKPLGRADALDLFHNVARTLGVDENSLPRHFLQSDYTLDEIADIIFAARNI